MPRRLILVGFVAVLAVLGVSCSDSKKPAADSVLPTQTIDAGSVTVTVTPKRFDNHGAKFAVSLDTHSVDLSMDLAESAVLVVDGNAWRTAGWSGGGPGGHHRSGELRFTPGGPARGTARLTIAGFPKPVEAT